MHAYRVRSTSTAALLGGLAVAFAAPLRAAPGATAASESIALEVNLTAPRDCSSQAALFEAVRNRSARVRRALSGERSALLEVRLERIGSAVRGDLRLSLEDGVINTRSVTGSSCDAVVDALSLTAALALESASLKQPGQLGAATVDSTSADADPNQATVETQSARSAPAPAARSEDQVDDGVTAPSGSTARARYVAEVAAQGAVARLVAPHLNVGGAVALRLQLERGVALSPSAGISFMYTDNGLFESSRHFALRAAGVALSLCPWRLHVGARATLRPCATGLGARLVATGRDLQQARSVTRSWWGAGAQLRGGVELAAGFGLELEAGVLVPLVTRAFTVEPTDTELGRTPGLSPFANLGIVHVL